MCIRDRNKKAQIILEEIIKLTKILSISTVVEGIETKEYHDFVKSLGCHYGQGYYCLLYTSRCV